MQLGKEGIWIEAGYEAFGLHGPDGVRVEQLARKVGISRSSFYHHFPDGEAFLDQLMRWHVHRGRELAKAAAHCSRVDPDFLRLLADHPKDLLFNRQLRIHRTQPHFQEHFEKAHLPVQEAVAGIWSEALGIPGQHAVARNIFYVVSEVFYQRITPEDVSYTWISGFLAEMHEFMRDVVRSASIAEQR